MFNMVGYLGYHYHCTLEICIYLVYITCFPMSRLMPGNCFSKTCIFKSNVTPPKTNIHTKNDGLEDVSPFKHDYFGYLCYFSGCKLCEINSQFRDDFQGKDLPIEIIEVRDVKPSKGEEVIGIHWVLSPHPLLNSDTVLV